MGHDTNRNVNTIKLLSMPAQHLPERAMGIHCYVVFVEKCFSEAYALLCGLRGTSNDSVNT